MIKELKRAAEWMGEVWIINHAIKPLQVIVKGKVFNPHEKTGRHLLVKMELKLDDKQWESYEGKMHDYWSKLHRYGKTKGTFLRWFKTAPSELCFEKLLEVIP